MLGHDCPAAGWVLGAVLLSCEQHSTTATARLAGHINGACHNAAVRVCGTTHPIQIVSKHGLCAWVWPMYASDRVPVNGATNLVGQQTRACSFNMSGLDQVQVLQQALE